MIKHIGRVLRHHWLITVLVVVGAALRAVTMLTYKPAIMFFGDSYTYIVAAQRLQPPGDRPFGYAFVLRVISLVGDLGLVVLLQHAAGLAMAVLLYVVILKRGAPRWLAAVVAAPLLLDGYLLQIEHNVLSETMFATLLIGAVVVVTREKLTPAWAIAGGTLLAAAALTRTVAIPIAALFIGYLLVRRLGVKVVAGFAVAMALPVLGYMAWFGAVYGAFATTDNSGRFLYGRVAVFADCARATLTPVESKLCDNADPASRPNANFYVWAADSPVRGLDLPAGQADQVAASYSRKIIQSQPLTFIRYAATDVGHYFAPGRYLTRVDSPLEAWRFPTTVASSSGSTSLAHNDLAGNPVDPGITAGPAGFLRGYQSIVYTQGPILLAGLVLGLLAGWIDRSRRRWDGPFVAMVGLTVLVIPSLTVMFDYRYGLPAIPLMMLAAGIGGTAILERRAARALAAQGVEAAPVRARRRHRLAPRPRPSWIAPGLTAAGLAAVLIAMTAAPLTRNTGYESYVGNRAELGTLGPPLSTAEPVPDLPGVKVQEFSTGVIVSSASSAAVVPNRIMAAVERNGGLAAFGVATSGESRTSYDSSLRVVTFERGWVYWSRLTGARAVVGDIFTAWQPKPVRSRLQEPMADAYTTPDGTTVQKFAGGTIVRFADGTVEVVIDRNRPKRSTIVTIPENDRADSSTRTR